MADIFRYPMTVRDNIEDHIQWSINGGGYSHYILNIDYNWLSKIFSTFCRNENSIFFPHFISFEIDTFFDSDIVASPNVNINWKFGKRSIFLDVDLDSKRGWVMCVDGYREMWHDIEFDDMEKKELWNFIKSLIRDNL